MASEFQMRTEYWEVEIKEGSSEKLTIWITFKDKVIPETELKKLEEAIRLLLEATGRRSRSPSKR